MTEYSILNASCFSGGITTRLVDGHLVPMLLNERVLVHKYFWKAVCDPELQSSVVFVAENPTGDGNNQPQGGCNLVTEETARLQTPNKGVIYCYSLVNLRWRSKKIYKKSDFKLPPFANACTPSVRGTFLDEYLAGPHGLR